jgi:hypothetical protein
MGNSLLSKPPAGCRLIPNSRKLKSGLLVFEITCILKFFFLVALLTCVAFGPVILMTRQALMMMVFQIAKTT